MSEPIRPQKQIPQTPEAKLVAENLLDGLTPERERLIEHHAREFAKVWRNTRVTPDEILAAMGDEAHLLLKGSRCSVANLMAIAAINGKTIDDIMPRSDWYPPREFIEHEDGTVTLGPPADDSDAWGNLIPIQEPEPEPAE